MPTATVLAFTVRDASDVMLPPLFSCSLNVEALMDVVETLSRFPTATTSVYFRFGSSIMPVSCQMEEKL